MNEIIYNEQATKGITDPSDLVFAKYGNKLIAVYCEMPKRFTIDLDGKKVEIAYCEDTQEFATDFDEVQTNRGVEIWERYCNAIEVGGEYYSEDYDNLGLNTDRETGVSEYIIND